jgi:uncharacterized protein YggE
MSQTQEHGGMKKMWYALIALAVVLLVGGIVAVGYFAYDFSKPISKISVNGQASVKLKPNEAKTTMYYTQVGDNLSTLNQEADKKTNQIKEYLIKQGIDEKDMVINKNSYPDYDSMPMIKPDGSTNSGQRKTRMEVSFQVTFKNIQQDLSKPNKILDEATKIGVTRFDPFQYVVENQKQICKDLQTKAIEDGYRQGEDRIKALGGGRIVRKEVQTFSDCAQDFRNYPVMAKEAMTSSSDMQTKAPDLTTGEQELVSQATVVLEYK